MKLKLLCLLILFIFLVVTGCAKNDLPELPNVGISAEQLNKDLKLVAFPTFNTFKIGESVNLEMSIESDTEVEVSPEFDSQIFVLNSETKKWQKVQEIPDLGIFEPQTFILSLEDGGIKEISVSLYPDLPISSEPVTLLIVITGNVLENGQPGDQKTGAYIIVNLKP